MVMKVFYCPGNKNKSNFTLRFNNFIMKLNLLSEFETNSKQRTTLFFFLKHLVTKSPISKKHSDDLSLWDSWLN